MDKAQQKLEELFGAGLDLEQARQFILQSLGEDESWVKEEVVSLWQNVSDGEDSSFDFDAILDFGGGLAPSQGDALDKAPNAYQILDSIASGGMGTVYKAQQQHPIKRLVALKTLNTGRISDEHMVRFQIEQNALAMMTHSYIASVYDSGVTDEGLPFYTMEFLDGLPITEYCDKHLLNLTQRLALFRKMCEGIQHAHQQGVIHRDLKPSNVLVVEQDGEPIPKIIDFGIAKLVDEAATADVGQTKLGAVVGTPDYMSPEQAGGKLVDTRTDIYSLGVMLYEMLVGVTPHGDVIGEAVSLGEICRIVQEDVPHPPHKRIDAHDLDIARKRGTLSPEGLSERLREDLSWITMKALAQDPDERYGTCAQMIRDIHCYLEDLPISVGPPGNAYYIKKFIRRHRRAVITVLFMLLMIIGGITAFFIQQRISNQRTLKEKARFQSVSDFLEDMLSSAHPAQMGRDARVIDIVNKAAEELKNSPPKQGEIQASLWHALADTYYGLGVYQQAINYFDAAYDIRTQVLGLNHKDTLASGIALARVQAEMGELKTAVRLAEQTLAYQQRLLPAGDGDILFSKGVLGRIYFKLGQPQKAEPLLHQALTGQRRLLGPGDAQTQITSLNLALVLADLNRIQEAGELYDCLLMETDVMGKNNPLTLYIKTYYGVFLQEEYRCREALVYHQEVFAKRLELLGQDHPATLSAMYNLGYSYDCIGNHQEGETWLSLAFWGMADQLGPFHPDTLRSASQLALTLKRLGKQEEVFQSLGYIETCQDLEHLNKTVMFGVRNNLADVLISGHQPERALTLLEETIPRARKVLTDANDITLLLIITKGEALAKMGQQSSACDAFLQAHDLTLQHKGADYWLNTAILDGYLKECDP